MGLRGSPYQSMTFNRKAFIGFYIFFAIGTWTLYGQQAVHFENHLVPKVSRSLKIDDALPTDCFEQMFIDQDGRMWLSPCFDAQGRRGLHLIQFDGYEGIIHNLALNPGANIVIAGFLHDTTIVGVDRKNDQIFLYDIPSSKTRLFEYEGPTGKFYNVHLIDEHIFVLAYSEKAHTIYELDGANIRKVQSSPSERPANFMPYSGILNYSTVIGSSIWFWDRNMNVFSYNAESGELNTYRIPSKTQLLKVHFHNWAGQLVVTNANPRRQNFYAWIFEDNQLTELNVLPPGWTYQSQFQNQKFTDIIYADQVGWLLVLCQNENSESKAILVNSEGEGIDYTEVISRSEKSEWDYITSNDFTKEVIFEGGKIQLIEIAQELSFETFRTGSARAMTVVHDSILLGLTHGDPYELNFKSKKPRLQKSILLDRIDPDRPQKIGNDRHGNIFLMSHFALHKVDPTSNQIDSWKTAERLEMIEYGEESLFAIMNGGIHEFNEAGGQFVPMSIISDITTVDGHVNQMEYFDEQLWIGTSTGLYYYDIVQEELNEVKLNDEGSFSIMTIMCDRNGVIWLGTDAYGVIRYHPSNQQVQQINRDEGLTHSTVVGLVEDKEGYIWASTFDGISVLSSEGDVIAEFNEDDGLVHNEGNRWSFASLPDSRVVIGTIEGISIIDPQRTLNSFFSTPKSKIYVSEITHPGRRSKDIVKSLNPRVNSRIFHFPANQRNMTINVGLSNYTDNSKNEFFYQINQPGSAWTSTGSDRQILLTNLPTGSYSISIKGRDPKGNWTANTIDVKVHVAKIFYKTWWFIAVCCIVFFGLLFMWYRYNKQERRRLEREVQKRTQQLSDQAERLRELDKEKTRIYTNITHEFRTPLTVIRGVTELPEGYQQNRSIIKRNVDRLLNLVNQLLELSKLESGQLSMDVIQADLVGLISDIFDSFSPIAESKDINMHFYSNTHNLFMDLDLEIIHRIVSNLLSNAIKFTPAGGNVYCRIASDEIKENEPSFVEISIRDTGIGIPESKIEKIFSRFYQVDNTTTRIGEGTGIGLALTKDLITFLGGSIQVESQENKGSNITVRLPRTQNEEIVSEPPDYAFSESATNSVLMHDDPSFHQSYETNRPVILIVEDNTDVIHYINQCLSDLYQVHMAMNGEEGVEKALEFVPDLIVSDIMMPVKDGIQLCDEIKNDIRTSHIPVILLSAKADIQSRMDGLRRGADAYLTKPFKKEELRQIIYNAIERANRMRERYGVKTIHIEEGNVELQLEDAFIKRLNEIIDTQLDNEDFGVSHMCQILKYSRSQVHNKVKSLTGISTSAYIQRRRMQHAKELLLRKELNVSEVAYQVGFRDPSYFARIFRKVYGISPTEYFDPPTES